MVKLSGFTFIRNAASLDYPVVESISSILPVVDEFIVNIGPGTDGTTELIHSIGSPKVKIIHSQWNPNLTTGGYVCTQQANIALFNCMGKWAFHLQADEVIHEKDLPTIMEYIDKYIDDDHVEGLAFQELFFWGDYKTIMNVYPHRKLRRCRIVKPHRFVLSRGDSAGFTVHPKYKEWGRRIRMIDTRVKLFHYCTLKSKKALEEKTRAISEYWGKNYSKGPVEISLYQQFPRQFMSPYNETHPKVMSDRISKHPVSIDLSSPRWRTQMTWKERWRLMKTMWVENITDRFSGRGSYKLVRK